MTLNSVTVETSAMTSPVLLHLDRKLVIALITQAEYHLVLFTFCCITVLIIAIIAVVAWYWYHRVASLL